jgi:hypothetical protein
LLYLPYRVLSFTYFIYYIPESDKRGIFKTTTALELTCNSRPVASTVSERLEALMKEVAASITGRQFILAALSVAGI